MLQLLIVDCRIEVYPISQCYTIKSMSWIRFVCVCVLCFLDLDLPLYWDVV